jgi:hypothetical protein
MHKHFADWYRECGISPTPEILEKRWTVIQSFASGINNEDLQSLVCTFGHDSSCCPQFPEKFSSLFHQEDTSFPMRNNQNELRILAGACLSEIFNGTSDIALTAAVCMTTSAFARPSSEPPFLDIITEATSTLLQASSDLRENVEYPEIPLIEPNSTTVLQDLKTKATANNMQQIQIVTPLIDALVRQEAALVDLASKDREFIKNAKIRIETLAEECNVLWWLLSAYSNEMEMPIIQINPKSIPIVIGKELASLISNLPGPASIKAILEKAMANEKSTAKSTILEIIDSIQPVYRKKIADKTQLNARKYPCTFPLHLAIVLSDELSGSKWDIAFAKRLGYLKLDTTFSPIQIAHQFYWESLLLQQTVFQE